MRTEGPTLVARIGVVIALLFCAGCGGSGQSTGQDAATPQLQAFILDAALDRPDASVVPRDAAVDRPDASPAMDASEPADAESADDASAYSSISLSPELTDTDHKLMAVCPSGVAYALALQGPETQLLASADGAQSFAPIGSFPGHDFEKMTCLSDGVLIADTTISGNHVLARSTNEGASWSEVLPIADRRMLQPHSVRELDGVVYFAEYQVTTQAPAPINVWASEDRGGTWSVRTTFTKYRHAHSLLADPESGALWVFMGDPTGETLRSLDGGFTWSVMIPGNPGVIVDALTALDGLLFGTDGLYLPAQPRIEPFQEGAPLALVRDLPAPSYSIHRARPAGFLLGTTHESDGDVYPPGDDSAHLFGSVDGTSWSELMALPRVDDTQYGRIDVYWDLPDGRIFVELGNVQGYGPQGNGFILEQPVLK